MKKKLVVSLISLICALVLCFGVAAAWFAFPITNLDMNSYDGNVKITFSRYNQSEGKYEEYSAFQKDGIELSDDSIGTQEYKIEITNEGNSACDIDFYFASMEEYITKYFMLEQFVDYYFENDKTFNNLVLETNKDESKVFEIEGTKYGLFEFCNYADGFIGNTARLLYSIRNFKVTVDGEEGKDYTSLTINELFNSNGSVENNTYGINLYHFSNEDSVVSCEGLNKNTTITISFTIAYTANTKLYENYVTNVKSNTDYIKMLREKEYSSGTFDSDDDAEAYLYSLITRETYVLSLGGEMKFLLKPMIKVTQQPRTEFS